MAAKVIPFPKTSGPDLNEIEKLIRLWLTEMSESRDFVDTIAARMMTFIDAYASKTFEPIFNLAAPPHLSAEERHSLLVSIETGVDNTAVQVQEMVNRIIVERLFLEVEIYESAQKRQSRHYPTV